jgi:hypothetical protein
MGTPAYSLAPAGGGDGDKLTSAVDAIIKAENKLLQSALAYAEAQEDVERLIRSVGDPQLEVVLEKIYLLFEKWEQIALDLSYSWRGIHKLHSKALSVLIASA